MLEPLTIGAHAAAKLELAPGDRVLVTGAGPIGISCALNAQTYGARVLLSDTNPGRRAFAAERFRLLALDPLDEHFTEQTAQFTEDSLFDAVIDTTAAKASMEQTWRWSGQGGKIVFVGICGTSGSELAFGEAFWDPSILVSHFGNPAVVIIFSLFIILATLTTNVACNLAAASVVFCSLFGKVLTYKKAVVVATILSICFLPWKLVENPESYVYTLNGTLAVFLGPITGICLAALWSQYRNRLRLPDLYYQDGGAYYYQGGWNVLALVTMAVLFIFIFVCQFIPVLRWIYDSSYLLGCVFAFVIYSALCKRQDR